MEQAKLEVTMVPIRDIIPYENNAKKHTEAQIEHICNSIKTFGFNDPIGIWHNGDGVPEVVTGHGALQAAKQLGMKEVPCTYLDHMTDEERRAYCHAHNQTQLETGFDYDALTTEIDTLSFDWDSLGFEQYGYSYIEDLMTEDFATNVTESSGDTFNITFTFPAEHREQVEAYLKDVGKQAIVDEIIERAV